MQSFALKYFIHCSLDKSYDFGLIFVHILVSDIFISKKYNTDQRKFSEGKHYVKSAAAVTSLKLNFNSFNASSFDVERQNEIYSFTQFCMNANTDVYSIPNYWVSMFFLIL